MTTLLLLVIIVAVFFVGLVSPHLAGKIQDRVDKKASRLKRISNWLWGPLSWWAKKSIEFSRKAFVKSADWGRKARNYLFRK